MHRSPLQIRAVLYITAVLCCLAIAGVLAPWDWLQRWMVIQYGPKARSTQIIAGLPAQPGATGNSEASSPVVVELPHSPVFEYWLRIACVGCVFVGAYFAIIARRPTHYARFVNLGAAGVICASAMALIAGVSLRLHPRGYLTDAIILLLLGSLMLLSSRGARRRYRRHTE